MKNYALLIIFFLLDLYSSFGKINFIFSLEDALIIAEEEQKPIFIDAMASWCGPCKMMDKEVFSDDLVASFFNENYVNVKIDADKNKRFRYKYDIRAYPTLLFLTSDGNVKQKKLGFVNVPQLYDLGMINLGIVYDFEKQSKKLKAIEDEDLFDFFDEQIELGGTKYLNFYGNKYLEDKGVNNEFRADLFSQLLPAASKKNVRNFIKSQYFDEENLEELEKIVESILSYSDNDIQVAQKELEKYSFKKHEKLKIYLESYFYSNSQLPFDKKNFKTEIDLVLFYPETKNIQLLGDVIKKMVLSSDNEIYIKRAKTSITKLLEKEQTVFYHDMLSLLYYKLGENELSLESITKAINLATEKQEKYKPSLQSLKKKIKPIE